MEMFPLVPTPLANMSGSIPKIMVREVIRIGLRRAFAADIAAWVIDIPSALFWEANSVRRTQTAMRADLVIFIICRFL
jgi:hypothetical protein